MKNALIIIDFQNDFVTGSLGFSGAEQLDIIIYNKILKANKQNETIIFTKDTHTKDYLSTAEGTALPVEHCIINTNGHDIYGKVGKLFNNNSICFNKETFASIELAKYIAKNKFDTITLVGLVSNICVLSNAILIKTFSPNTEITVDSNATKSFNTKLNEETFDILRGLYIKVI